MGTSREADLRSLNIEILLKYTGGQQSDGQLYYYSDSKLMLPTIEYKVKTIPTP